jgi:CCR4-NOT transcriptional regulation complex NOT5 subunit
LAAQELRSRGWEFSTRFLTWMKKEQNANSNRQNSSSRGGKQPKSKTLYFDFEGDWRVKMSMSNEPPMDDSKFSEKDEK